ncbi:hypothetical protein ACU610_16935 [Geodermatophilus sp. URMC 61]|uniref:hypothetical protein n=1 Tax=Geodermatophilus sp. URMC 61 TaxID=3423411 RepID=UPI00406D0373
MRAALVRRATSVRSGDRSPRASSWSGYTLTAHQAVQVLARVSQQTNRKLVGIAEELNRTGVVPQAD